MNEIQQRSYRYFLDNGFIPVKAESHRAIREFNADNRLYEMTASLTVTWSGEFNTLYRIVDGFLCTLSFYRDGEISFCIHRPRQAHDLKHIVDTLYGLSLKAGLNALVLWAVEERFLEEYKNIQGYQVKAEYSDNLSEYVYSARDLLDLQGEPNYYKRKRLKMFLDKPNISIEAMTRENAGQCLEIEERWCALQDCKSCESFAGCSKKTLEIMIVLFDDHIYRGILGYIDGIPSGYVIFEKAGENLAYIHFAKASLPNFNVYLYYIITQRYLCGMEYINNGADLGKQGLRVFKRGLGNHGLWKKYLCTFIRKQV
jgi:hypothetical protein